MRLHRLEYYALYEFFLQKSLELNRALKQGRREAELNALESGVADIHERLLRQRNLLHDPSLN